MSAEESECPIISVMFVGIGVDLIIITKCLLKSVKPGFMQSVKTTNKHVYMCSNFRVVPLNFITVEDT